MAVEVWFGSISFSTSLGLFLCLGFVWQWCCFLLSLGFCLFRFFRAVFLLSLFLRILIPFVVRFVLGLVFLIVVFASFPSFVLFAIFVFVFVSLILSLRFCCFSLFCRSMWTFIGSFIVACYYWLVCHFAHLWHFILCCHIALSWAFTLLCCCGSTCF